MDVKTNCCIFQHANGNPFSLHCDESRIKILMRI
jgi:hypothetical protein